MEKAGRSGRAGTRTRRPDITWKPIASPIAACAITNEHGRSTRFGRNPRPARGARGREYWRCLDEVAETPAFEEFLTREYPAGASEWRDEFSRRHFLQIMAASFALAGLNACTKQPLEKIVPYVKQPPELTPGKPCIMRPRSPSAASRTA